MHISEIAEQAITASTTAPGAISAAILAGSIVIAVKIYDYYHNKAVRELKEIIDIAKESDRLPENGKEAVQLLLEQRSEEFEQSVQRNKRFKAQSEKFQDRYNHATAASVISFFAICVLWVLATLFGAMKLEDLSWELIAWIVIFGAIFAISFTFVIVMRRKFRKGNHRIKNKSLREKVKARFNR